MSDLEGGGGGGGGGGGVGGGRGDSIESYSNISVARPVTKKVQFLRITRLFRIRNPIMEGL